MSLPGDSDRLTGGRLTRECRVPVLALPARARQLPRARRASSRCGSRPGPVRQLARARRVRARGLGTRGGGSGEVGIRGAAQEPRACESATSRRGWGAVLWWVGRMEGGVGGESVSSKETWRMSSGLLRSTSSTPGMRLVADLIMGNKLGAESRRNSALELGRKSAGPRGDVNVFIKIQDFTHSSPPSPSPTSIRLPTQSIFALLARPLARRGDHEPQPARRAFHAAGE